MTNLKPNRQPILDLTSGLGRLSLLVLLLGIFSLYVPINWPWGQVHQLETPFDHLIPLIPEFVISYVFIFLVWGAGLVLWTLWRRPAIYVKLMVTLLAGTVIAYVIYLTYQTIVPRPPLEVHDFFTQVLKWIYSSDRRYNAFPSGHTYTTVILLLSTWPLVRTIGRIVALVAGISIISATLFLKQHYLPDVAGGIVLGVLAAWLGGKTAPFFSSDRPGLNAPTRPSID